MGFEAHSFLALSAAGRRGFCLSCYSSGTMAGSWQRGQVLPRRPCLLVSVHSLSPPKVLVKQPAEASVLLSPLCAVLKASRHHHCAGGSRGSGSERRCAGWQAGSGAAICLVVTDRGREVAQEPEAGLFHSRDPPTGGAPLWLQNPFSLQAGASCPTPPPLPSLCRKARTPESSHLPAICSVPPAL